jgi:uncharacterized membrane protein
MTLIIFWQHSKAGMGTLFLFVRGNDYFSVDVYKLNGEAVRTIKNTDGTIRFQIETGPVFIQFKQKVPYFDVYSLKVLLQK